MCDFGVKWWMCGLGEARAWENGGLGEEEGEKRWENRETPVPCFVFKMLTIDDGHNIIDHAPTASTNLPHDRSWSYHDRSCRPEKLRFFNFLASNQSFLVLNLLKSSSFFANFPETSKAQLYTIIYKQSMLFRHRLGPREGWIPPEFQIQKTASIFGH